MTAAGRGAALVAWWVGFYTRRLPAEVAARRRAELASDLWEQQAEGRAGGPALSILRRMAAGVPADLRWRQEQLAAARDRSLEPGARHGWRALVGDWWLGLAGLLALFEVAFGVAVARDAYPGAVGQGGKIAAGGLLLLLGIAVRRRWRVAGDLTVAAGALPAVPWLGTIGPVALLPFAALTVIVSATFDATTARGNAARDVRPGVSDRTLLGNAVVFLAMVLAYSLLRPGQAGSVTGGIVLILLGCIGLRRRGRRRRT